jgi:hypothetical protein
VAQSIALFRAGYLGTKYAVHTYIHIVWILKNSCLPVEVTAVINCFQFLPGLAHAFALWFLLLSLLLHIVLVSRHRSVAHHPCPAALCQCQAASLAGRPADKPASQPRYPGYVSYSLAVHP